MSILHDRILRLGMSPMARADYQRPDVGQLSATPMVMPLARVHYGGMGAHYEDLHAEPATADPNHVPFAVVPNGTFGIVVPAGRA